MTSKHDATSIIILTFIFLAAGKLWSMDQAVVSYNPKVTKVGEDILRSGGNAFDAFVAATVAQYVLGEGVTSISGPLGALLYDAKERKIVYLDAGFDDPRDPRQRDPKNPQPGRAALVPGAVAGLEAISQKYGRLRFSKVLEPAIKLASDGFQIGPLYASLIRAYRCDFEAQRVWEQDILSKWEASQCWRHA